MTEQLTPNLHSSQAQNLRLFRIFNYYRVLLSVLLAVAWFNHTGQTFISIVYPKIFLIALIAYSALAIITTLASNRQHIEPQQILMSILIDIGVLAILTYSQGGAAGGLSGLMIFPIAAGSIMLGGQFALFLAAAASLAILCGEWYRVAFDDDFKDQFFQAGVSGMVYFTTALLVRYIAQRIQSTESLAEKQAVDIASLEQLNQLILQRMHTGIIVCHLDGRIRMMNQAARRLLSSPHEKNHYIMSLPKPLLERLNQWQTNPHQRTQTFQFQPGNPEIQANFAQLMQGNKDEVLIFIENTSKSLHQAQQLKLASLGQLTASIAHEIRNPLGAISHAAQLLSEAETLPDTEVRLAQIVQDHSKRLNQIIENVLQLSRRRTTTPEEINLHQWLKNLIAELNQSHQETIEYSIDISPENMTIKFDSIQLTQVIQNLVQNGLRYSSQQCGKPIVHFRAGVIDDSGLPYLDIIDEGAGINDEHIARLFEPFFTTEHNGTGLGLYLCKELCESNHAHLDYVSTHKPGSCFRIIFPHPDLLAA